LFFDIVEKRGEEEGPELVWEYWDGSAWRRLAVQDETGHLSRPGMIGLIGPEDAASLPRFGTARHWLRARLREDGPPPRNLFNAIHLNAVWASQRQTVRNETIGQSNGLPNQFFRLRQFPVLAGEKIEVREVAGPLAEIEYPILRDELGEGKLRTVTGRNGKVIEVWVRWESRSHLFFSGPEDRHYFVNRTEGRVLFGDGVHGKVPPSRVLILAAEYQAGGGKSGNVPRRAINQLLAGIAGVQEVFNALPAEGGTDAEPIAAIATRGPRTLRHRGRAMTGRDYEVMAREASPEVAWVRVFQASDAFLGPRPGHVLLMILPETKDRRPWPSFGLRERVRQYLENRALACLCPVRCIHVAGPQYFPIDVEVTVVPNLASEAGTIEKRVRAALEEFLHPLRGGPRGNGWELGRDVYLSDVASVVENVPGVDFAQEIVLLRDNTPQGNRIAVPRDRLVVAGEIHIKVLLP
jgi:predicted phage baseplate assembly protein